MSDRNIFLSAVDIADPAARAAYLDRACAGDADLRRKVDELLAAHAEAGSFLDPSEEPLGRTTPRYPAAEPARPDVTRKSDRPHVPGARPPTTDDHVPAPTAAPDPDGLIAGKYKLLDRVGEGGMGEVWRADQLRPVKRRVAVKLIKDGMDSRAVLARFEAERQALALMDHPHIAKVLDAGATPDGRPFFVMELVKGVPLTEYCDAHKLTVPQRLEVFRQVCSAVQHAHQKGVIHRDLKPSNVLVESHDGKPVPKVIDFGLAKAVHALPLTDKTLFTGYGALLGTPLYMAPEQATFNAVDVDTRADVYALGVILYELLTGETPISRGRLRKAALDEMLRVIREEEPPTPSSRLSTAEGTPSVAAVRGIEPKKLGRFVKGDLDWIVMKALAKDRDRRYDTANGLAADVGRFLADEPVLAGPPGAGYRVRKFVKRNKGRVAAAGLVLLALVAGIAGTTAGLLEARAHREAAVAQAAAATAAREFLQSVMVLGDPSEATKDRPADPNRTFRATLDFAAKDIEGRFADQPLIAADLRNTIGVAYQSLGAYEAARPHLVAAVDLREKALGPGHPDTLKAVRDLASLYASGGDRRAAEPLYQRALAGIETALGPDHPDALAAVHGLAGLYKDAGDIEQAEPLYRRALAGREKALGPDHDETLATAHNLAVLYADADDPKQAEPLLKRALAGLERAHGPDHPFTLRSVHTLAALYSKAGDPKQAEPLYRRALAGLEKALGPDHPVVLATVHGLAVTYSQTADRRAAEGLYRRALAGQEKALGPDHPDTLRIAGNLATLYKDAGDLKQAEPLYRRVLAGAEAALGPDHPDTLRIAYDLAVLHQNAGNPRQARPLFRRAADGFERALGPDHPDTLWGIHNAALLDLYAGEYPAAEPPLKRALAGLEKALGPDHRRTLSAAHSLATLYSNVGDRRAAEGLYRRALAGQEKALGPDHPDTLLSAHELGVLYSQMGDRRTAEVLLRRALAGQEKALAPDHSHTMASVWNLAVLYRNAGDLKQAEPLYRRALSGRERALGPDHPDTLLVVANLGVLLTQTDRPAEAIPLLQRAHAARAKYPARFEPVGDHLFSAYILAGRSGDAARVVGEALADERAKAAPGSPELGGLLAQAGKHLLALDPAAAEPVLRECLELRRKLAPTAWNTANAESLLGGALLLQGKPAEAEPLLVAGYEGLKSEVKNIPPQGWDNVPDAADRLVELYERLGKPDEVKKWRAERAKYPFVAPPPRPAK